MSEAALRERIDELEEEVRQLRDQLGFDAGENFLGSCREKLGLSPSQGRILNALMVRERASREFLLEVIVRDHAAEHELNLVSVQVSHLRRRLRPFGVFIETIWGFGLRLTPDNRAKVLALLGLEQP